MSLIKFAHGVVVSQQAIIACAIVNSANQLGLPVDMLITSGRDGKHMVGSRHYYDCALDLRTHHLTTTQKHALLETIRKRLGVGYDAILEDEDGANEHIHVEYDPK